MFAVIKTGGKQYRVAGGDEFTIERLPGASGDSVTFAEVLMVGTSIGAPFVSGASVVAEIVDQVRGPKVISFKKRRRQNSKRSRGHRQDLTLVRISEILTDGRQPSERKAVSAETATSSDTETSAVAEKPKRAAKKSDAAEGAAEAPKKPRASKKKDETAEEA